MSFDEVRLPEDIERGAVGGPEFNTIVHDLSSGFEKRNQKWAKAKYNWDISYGIQNKLGYSSVVNFFLARRGKARGFRFRDWSDYEGVSQPAIATGIVVLEYQLTKQYIDSAILNTYTRNIYKPVDGSINIFDAGVLVSDSRYSIDYTTGIVTFNLAPMGLVTWTGEFDIPVRFNSDRMEVNIDWIEAGAIPNIVIKELYQ